MRKALILRFSGFQMGAFRPLLALLSLLALSLLALSILAVCAMMMPVRAQVVQSGSEQSGCYATKKEIARGDALEPGLLSVAPCTDMADPPELSFDRKRGHIIAAEPIAAGTNIGRIWIAQAPAKMGDELILVARAGPVAVHRQVVALQSARPGRRLFVRDQEGEVFSILFQPGEEE